MLYSPPTEDVQSANMLRHTKRMIDFKRHMHDGVTEPDALSHHRRGRQKLLRTGKMGVARQEMMLDGPHRVKAQLIGISDLLQGLSNRCFTAPGTSGSCVVSS
jgi:hypothetical protein